MGSAGARETEMLSEQTVDQFGNRLIPAQRYYTYIPSTKRRLASPRQACGVSNYVPHLRYPPGKLTEYGAVLLIFAGRVRDARRWCN